MTYGITATGFTVKPATDIKAELDAYYKANILGESAGTEPDGSIPAASIAGQIIAVKVDGLSALWDLAEAAYSALDPTQATDAALDSACALTGTVREPARYSEVIGICRGTVGTVLDTGRVATVTGTGTRFASTASATLAAVADAWTISTAYAVYDLVTNAGNSYICITAGTSAGAGGPTTTANDITDGSAHWRYMGASTIGVALVEFRAEDPGPLAAAAFTLATIATPVSGWTSVGNLEDATLGADLQTDAELRILREAEISAQGAGTADAIRADVLRVGAGSTDPTEVVTSCTVFVNDTDATNSDGLPPHSVEVLVLGGTDADVALAIWNSVGAGIYTYGSTTETITDAEGNSQTVRFTRPTEIRIYVVATVYYDPTAWPASGAAALVEAAAQGAMTTFAASAYQVGVNVRATPLAGAVLEGPTSSDAGATAAPGIVDVTPVYIGTAPAPGAATPIVIGTREIATLDSADIDITATPLAP